MCVGHEAARNAPRWGGPSGVKGNPLALRRVARGSQCISSSSSESDGALKQSPSRVPAERHDGPAPGDGENAAALVLRGRQAEEDGV
jgi:hypothetical protein